MTLLQLITVLSSKNINVVVKDGDTDNVLIEFKSSGIASVEGDVSARTVRRWEITGAQAITVVLDAAV